MAQTGQKVVGSAEASDHPGGRAKWVYRNPPQAQSFTIAVSSLANSLQQENDRLKKIIAKQALEIDFKDELPKKSP